MKMDGLRLEAADGGVVQLAGYMARNVPHEEAHHLVGDAAAHAGDALDDERADRGRREPFGVDRVEVQDLTRQRHDVPLGRALLEVHQQPSLPR